MVKKHNRPPSDSILFSNLDGTVDYLDSYSVTINNQDGLSVDELATRIFSSSPSWVKALMMLRDVIVKPLGLKTASELEGHNELQAPHKNISYQSGDRLALFPVIQRSDKEIVMGENDKHLYFRVSVYVKDHDNPNPQTVYVTTTIVQFHNHLGKAYFIPVKPFHKAIVKQGLKIFKDEFEKTHKL